MKNAYVGRTFIQPSQTIRQLGIRLKLNPLKEVIRGKRLIVVDDSIVRGNTQRALIRMLREAGAVEVHVRIASPPVKWPCFYGIDFATPAELIANAVERRARRGRDARGGAARHRRRHARLHLAARHDRGHRTAGRRGCARRASTATTRSSCPAKRRWARTSSSTCWPTRPAPASRCRPTTTTPRRFAGPRSDPRSRVPTCAQCGIAGQWAAPQRLRNGIPVPGEAVAGGAGMTASMS